MANEKPVEDRIVEYYLAEDGTWLVEKGKVKEAKLLKEADARIRQLKKEVRFYEQKWSEKNRDRIDLRREIEEEIKKRVNGHYEETSKFIDELVSEIAKSHRLAEQKIQKFRNFCL